MKSAAGNRLRCAIQRRDITMAKTLECKDLGMDCDFKASGETLEEVMAAAGAHAATAHGMTSMSPEMMAQVAGAVREA
jgi:predicted small metal-binding protein